MNLNMWPVLVAVWESGGLMLNSQAPYEWGWRMHPMWGWGIVMIAMMFFFWGIVIVAAVFCVRWFVGQTKQSHGDSAVEILRERFARGEIEKDEFEAKKTALK